MTTDQREVDKAHDSLDAAGAPRAASGSPIRLFSRIDYVRQKHADRLLTLNAFDQRLRTQLESVAESIGPCEACERSEDHICNHTILQDCIRELTQRWNWKAYR